MVSAPPAPPPFRVSQRFRYRELLGLVAVQSFGNQMTGSFWIIYLVSRPQPLDFRVATLLWVIAFLTAALGVLLMARGRRIAARTSMTVGLGTMAAGHFAFAFLPANWVVLVGGLAFGVYLPLFWLPMNSLLVRATRRRRIALGRDAAGFVPSDEGFVRLRSPICSVLARGRHRRGGARSRIGPGEGPESVPAPGTGPVDPGLPARILFTESRIVRVRNRLALDDLGGRAVVHLHDSRGPHGRLDPCGHRDARVHLEHKPDARLVCRVDRAGVRGRCVRAVLARRRRDPARSPR